MKKVLKIAVPICVIVGCVVALAICYLNSLNLDENENGVCSLELDCTYLNKTVGDKFNIIDSCGLEYDAFGGQRPYFKSEDYSVLNVNSTNGNAECLSEGNVKIFVLLKSNGNDVLKEEIEVDISEKIVYPTSVDIEKRHLTMLVNEQTTNKLVLSENSNAPITVSYQNGLVSYDYKTGIVKSKGTAGEDVVYIKVAKSETEKFSLQFKVTVCDKNEIEINETINIGQTIKIDYEDYLTQSYNNSVMSAPITSNANVLVENASDYGSLVISGLGAGECVITFDDGINFIKIKIIVE